MDPVGDAIAQHAVPRGCFTLLSRRYDTVWKDFTVLVQNYEPLLKNTPQAQEHHQPNRNSS